MLGQTLTYFIYIRNLQIQGEWQKTPISARLFLWVFPILIVVYYFNNNTHDIDKLFKNEAIPHWLLILGIIGQVIFTFRFIYQWMYSEKNKESMLPIGFWILSLIGSFLILIYAILRKDIVLFLGHLLGSIIYSRNIIISKNDL